jgi:hypothetical protein
MAIPSRQIGWSQKANLLWQISKQLEKLTQVAGNVVLTTTTTTSSTSTSTTSTTTTSGSLYEAVPVYIGTNTFDACTNGGTPNGTFYVASGNPIVAGTTVYENSSLTTPAAGYNALMFNGVPPVFNTDEAGVLVFVYDCA